MLLPRLFVIFEIYISNFLCYLLFLRYILVVNVLVQIPMLPFTTSVAYHISQQPALPGHCCSNYTIGS